MPHVTNVLIVEDDERIRRALIRRLREVLGSRGLSVVILETDRAQAAFDLIHAKQDDAWFVLTDNNLDPSVGTIQTGLDLIHRVRGLLPGTRSFLILTSGRVMNTEDFELFGVDLFMLKPCEVEVLADLLSRFLASD